MFNHTFRHIFILLDYCGKRKLLVTMSPDWDWRNFGKKKKKSPHPHRRGDRPPETVNPRPLIDLKREAAFSDWQLFNTATLSRLLLRCLCQIRSSLCLSIMFRMLKHHFHPGFFLLFIWLSHLMEHQKVQGKISSSIFLNYFRFVKLRHAARHNMRPSVGYLLQLRNFSKWVFFFHADKTLSASDSA